MVECPWTRLIMSLNCCFVSSKMCDANERLAKGLNGDDNV